MRKRVCFVLAAALMLMFLTASAPLACASIISEMPVISAGHSHTAAVLTDGSLWVWGNNGNGRVGDETVSDRHAPAHVMDNVAGVSAGYYTMAIQTDGSLWAWGQNWAGQLGDGTTRDRRTPVRIMNDVSTISAAGMHAMAVRKDGSLWAWGDNSFGQYGSGTTDGSLTPVRIMEDVAEVSAGSSHVMAVRKDGSLWAWGNNFSGQLGDGTTQRRLTPISIMDNAAAVATGGQHTMAIRADGSLWAWGNNRYGQLGDGTTTDRHRPVKVMDNVASVSAGRQHTVIIQDDGSLWAWGNNRYGQLGDGTTTDRHRPVKIMDDAAAASLGVSHTIAVQSDGSLWAWGRNESGRLGDGTTEDRNTPVKIMDEVMLPSARTENEILLFLSKVTSTPNVTIDYNATTGFSTLNEYADYLENAVKNTDGADPNNAAIREISRFIQYAVTSRSTAAPASRDNQLTVTGSDIRQAAESARRTYEVLTDVLSQQGIRLGRSVTTLIRVEGHGLDLYNVTKITLDRTLIDVIGENTLTLLLGDSRHAVSITGGDLQTIVDKHGIFTMWAERSDDGAYAIVFFDENDNILNKLPASVTFMLPAECRFDTVLASYSSGVENRGGQYDESAKTILFSTPFSGKYEIIKNLPEIDDISEFPDEVQSAVLFMVSKGFFDLTDGGFDPNASLTRYDFSRTLMRVLFEYDEIAPWAEDAAALAVREGIAAINSVFLPLREITRAETAMIAYRLFSLLYETPPVEIPMAPMAEYVEDMTDIEEPETEEPEKPAENDEPHQVLIFGIIIGLILLARIVFGIRKSVVGIRD